MVILSLQTLSHLTKVSLGLTLFMVMQPLCAPMDNDVNHILAVANRALGTAANAEARANQAERRAENAGREIDNTIRGVEARANQIVQAAARQAADGVRGELEAGVQNHLRRVDAQVNIVTQTAREIQQIRNEAIQAQARNHAEHQAAIAEPITAYAKNMLKQLLIMQKLQP
jgi:hypothetical protein